MSRVTPNYFNVAGPLSPTDNSPYDYLSRESGIFLDKEVTITGTGAIVANVLQFTGTIIILNQFAEITEVTTLNNCTDVYATAYDGTNSVDLAADGATLSGAPVGSFFTKDKIASQPYSVSLADEVRLLETLTDKKSGRPFTLTAKTGVDNFIRFHLTTTDAPINFKTRIVFEYRPVDGGTLEFL